MYGLHPLMPTKYIVLVVGVHQKNNTSMKVLTSRISNLKELQEVKMQVVKINGIHNVV
jgi:hypothetical protein